MISLRHEDADTWEWANMRNTSPKDILFSFGINTSVGPWLYLADSYIIMTRYASRTRLINEARGAAFDEPRNVAC